MVGIGRTVATPTLPAPPSAAPADRWKVAQVSASATIADAIQNLDLSSLQIVLVTTPDGRLVGTVTDGDIRRGLLRGLGLASPVEAIVHREPLVVPPHLGRETALRLMQANQVSQLPVVDDNRQLVGLHVLSQLLETELRPNLMVVMAGGEGQRLRPQTETCPKPMLPISGKPILAHIVDRARREGIVNFVFAVRYLGNMIEDYFGDGASHNVKIDYLHENSPLGTAGALSLLRPRPQAPFLVSNGDVLTDVRYGEVLDFHVRHRAMATMAVRLHEWQNPFGVVRTSGVDIVGFEEKPITRSHINAGVYVLDPEALDDLGPGERCDMPTLFGRLLARGCRTIAYPMHEPWLDVGSLGDLRRAQEGAVADTEKDNIRQ